MMKDMKKDIHPQYHKNAKIICACGNTLTVGSTTPEIHVEVCSNCHPFYTGKQKLVDTARRVEKFQQRSQKKTQAASQRKGRKAKKQRALQRKTKNEKNKNLSAKKTSL